MDSCPFPFGGLAPSHEISPSGGDGHTYQQLQVPLQQSAEANDVRENIHSSPDSCVMDILTSWGGALSNWIMHFLDFRGKNLPKNP